MAIYLIFKLFGFLGRLGIKQLSPKELDRKKGMVILDVRTNKEYEGGHIPGSIHVPLSDIGSKIKKLKKDKELVVYCQSGNRSIWAIKRLMGMGYKEPLQPEGRLQCLEEKSLTAGVGGWGDRQKTEDRRQNTEDRRQQ